MRPVQVHADELAGSEDVEQRLHALLRQENIAVGVQKRFSYRSFAKQAVLTAP